MFLCVPIIGWCSTLTWPLPPLLLICSSFHKEHGHRSFAHHSAVFNYKLWRKHACLQHFYLPWSPFSPKRLHRERPHQKTTETKTTSGFGSHISYPRWLEVGKMILRLSGGLVGYVSWLVVSTHLKNMLVKLGIPQVEVKIQDIWNQHLGDPFPLEAIYTHPGCVGSTSSSVKVKPKAALDSWRRFPRSLWGNSGRSPKAPLKSGRSDPCIIKQVPTIWCMGKRMGKRLKLLCFKMKLGYTKIIQNMDFMNANLDNQMVWSQTGTTNGPKLYWNPKFLEP